MHTWIGSNATRGFIVRFCLWNARVLTMLAVVFAALAASPAESVTTTTSLIAYDGSGRGIPIPPPTAITVYVGTPVVLQGWIEYPTAIAQPNPSGSIAFYDGAQLLTNLPISSGTYPCSFICSAWQAKLTTTTLGVGVHTISAVYGGDGLYQPSTSNVATVTVSGVPPGGRAVIIEVQPIPTMSDEVLLVLILALGWIAALSLKRGRGTR
jgi:hypothetical protein